MLSFLPVIATLLALSHHNANIVLITLDGTRWQEVFYGTEAARYNNKFIPPEELLPNIYKYFVKNGTVYPNAISSNDITLSLPSYMEIMRGHPTKDCFSNVCNLFAKNTIIDYFYEHHSNNIAVFSSWNTIRQAVGYHANKIKLSTGKQQDVFYKHSLGEDNYRLDEYTASAALKYYADAWPEFMYVSLGDSDEYGHLNNYEKYISSMQLADAFIGNLINNIYPNTTIILTTDHGRSKNFKDHRKSEDAKRVWIMLYGRDVSRHWFINSDKNISLSNIYPTILDLVFNKTSQESLIIR